MRCFGAMVLGSIGFLVLSPERALAYSCVGAQGFSSAEFVKVKKAVDPTGSMGESTRNLAAIGAIYQFKMNKGDADEAACAAYQMISYYRQAADKYAALATVAGEKGQTDVIVHAAMQAYANVPDGKNLHIVKLPDGNLQYSFADVNGQVMQQGIEPPDKLAASAMGFAQAGFDKTLLAAAEPEITRKAVQGRSMAPGKPKAMLDMLPIPPLHAG
jgi:hypothetical protein